MTIEKEKEIIDKVNELVDSVNTLKKIILEQDKVNADLQNDINILSGRL